jgi:ABC-type sulfate transport system permease subunit
MGIEMKFKLIGDVYMVCGLLTLLTLFMIDCSIGNQLTLHLIGIIFNIPGLAYCIFRLFLDSHDYLTTRKVAK